MSTRKYDIKALGLVNKQKVIDIIRKNDKIFSAEIARVSGLSIPTVMKITDEFLSRGLIKDIGRGESTGGKPPKMFELVKNAYYSIGVDIGKTTIKVVMINICGDVCFRTTESTGETADPVALVERVVHLIEFVLWESKAPRDHILGIGVGMPGLIDSESGVVLFSPDFFWDKFDIISQLKKYFDFNIVLENSTRAKVLAEKWFGIAQDEDDFICLNLGYGIAAAFMMNGEVYFGKSGSSGEFGHLTLQRDGPKCDCGNYGCLEALSSGNAIAKKMIELVKNGHETSVLKYTADNDVFKIDAKAVFAAFAEEDELAKTVVDSALEYLGIGLAGLINIFDPSMIILSGGITENGATIVNQIRIAINIHLMRYAGRNVRIVISKLGHEGTAIGAATILVKQLVENGGQKNTAS